jgi:PIN domain nuclease of toxin-antitoxin system
LIYLDTHVVVWLFAGLVGKFNRPVVELINEHELDISPIVLLELQYLYEVQRTTKDAMAIVTDLSQRVGLKVCDKDFNAIISQALAHSWTRDPFDRVIVAHASLHGNLLITKDQTILENYPHARW